jgi:hypothetical protein
MDSRRIHEFPQGIEYARNGLFMGAELLVVSRQSLREPRFDLIEVLCEFLIGCEERAQPHEGSHNENVDLNCSLTIEHGRQHRDP